MKNCSWFAKAVEHFIISTGTRQAPGYFRQNGNIECIQFRIKLNYKVSSEFAAKSVCIHTTGDWSIVYNEKKFMICGEKA